MGKPKLIDPKMIASLGINPKTGLPIKFGSGKAEYLKEDIARCLRVIDRQDATNRYSWFNLPSDLDGNLIERILYYKGQGCFFFIPQIKRFYFLPYTLYGNLDAYGRYQNVIPVMLNGSPDDKPTEFIKGLTRDVQRSIILPEDWKEEYLDTKCVLLSDYVQGIDQNIIPRNDLNRPLIQLESEMLPFMRTGLISSSGVSALRVSSQDEQSNVKVASDSIEHAALVGEKFIPVIGSLDFQDLANTNQVDANQYLLAMQSIDNMRLSTLGLSNGGLFQKEGTILQSEALNANANTGLILQDGLKLRQDFCNIVNSLFGLRIWCEITQPATLPMSQDLGLYNDLENENNGTTDNTMNEGDDNEE